MFVSAIVAAGGRGLRLGGDRPKQLLTVGGRAVLERSVAAFLDHAAVNEIVVALPAELAGDPPAYLRGTAKPLRVVPGGTRRQDSVASAFDAIAPESTLVVVHDAARPFVSADLIQRTIDAAAAGGAAVAAVAARDTLKQAAADGGGRRIAAATLPRDGVYLAQTPQAFRREVLAAALALGRSGVEATDEAALAEGAGHRVLLVDGESTNMKITTADDLPIAEAIARGRAAGAPPVVARAGTGYDLHRLVEGRPLVLGGVAIPFERGLFGHSDADAVCHAVTDAILGAACAGDIGRHFPDSDPLWRGASSLDLLRRAAALVREGGFDVSNVDVVVIAERPKIGPHADAMRANLAGALGIGIGEVSVKGKTNEGVDAIGRGEAIAVHAVAMVSSRRVG